MHDLNFSVRSVLAQAKTYRTEILIALTVLLVFRLILSFLNSRKRNFPPGPRGLPIVGYLPFMSKDIHLDFIEIGKKYGGVFSVKLGDDLVVVLNDPEAVKEAMTNNKIQGRDAHRGLGALFPKSAFFAKDNLVWREQRRFVVTSMKDLGLGKSKIEYEIQDEIDLLLDILKETKRQPLDLKKPLSPSMSNNICALVFGKRYDFNDPIRNLLDSLLNISVRNVSQIGIALSFPWLMYIPFVERFFPIKKAIESFESIYDICREEMENHRKDFDGKNVRDFIDNYLLEIEAKKKVANTSFDEETLIATAVDLFGAGSETVRTSILWCIYVIAAYPEVQKKIQKEIIDVVGTERSPKYSDQKEMPFTHSVILEIQRLKTIVPINLIRRVTSDTKVAGYDIPKGTNILANLWSVHHDPKLWDNPDDFKPERFLSPDKKSVIKSSNFMAFSLGKRSCPGETMANLEMFLYFTSILQKFDVVLPEGEKADLEGTLAVVYLPKPYKVCFIPRT